MARGRDYRGTIVSEEVTFDYENYVKKTVKDYFIEYLFPDAIIYGMSYDEFWYEDPELFFSYRFSFLKKLEIEQQKANYQAWLYGLYNYQAHSISLANAFGNNKTQKIDYPDKPLEFNKGETVHDKEDKFLNTRRFWSRFKENKERRNK